MTLRCSSDSRRLVQTQEGLKSKVDIDKLDSCNEVTLGLCATVCLATAICVFAMPLFQVAGMAWVQAWERLHPSHPVAPITLAAFNHRMNATYKSPLEAFEAMDENMDEFADKAEFFKGVSRFSPPLTQKQAEYAFKGLDENNDQLLESMEFENAVKFPTFYHQDANAAAEELRTVSATAQPQKVPVRYVGLDMTVENFDHALLGANAALLSVFNRTLREALASVAGFGVTPAAVDLALSPGSGSTLVHAVVRPPAGVDARSVQMSLNASAVIASTVSHRFEAAAEVRTVSTGPLDVARVSKPEILESGRFAPLQAPATTAAATTSSSTSTPAPSPEHAVSIRIVIPGIDLQTLPVGGRHDIEKTVVKDLAYLAGIPGAMVRNAAGEAGKATVSARPGGGGGLAVELLLAVPRAESCEDVIAVMTSAAAKQYVANELGGLPSFFAIASGSLDAKSIEVDARVAGASTSSTTPTTTPRTAARKAQRPEDEAKSHLSFQDFEAAVRHPYGSPADMVDACHEARDDSLEVEEFVRCMEKLEKPLTRTEAENAFRSLDTNEDGLVDLKELRDMLSLTHNFPAFGRTNVVPQGGASSTQPPISMEDFKKRQEAVMHETQATARRLEGTPIAAFLKLDTDSDGYMSKEEFVEATSNFDPPLSKKQAEYAFDGFDTDHDKRVSASEFMGEEREEAGHLAVSTPTE
eukprot:CAMPEP_0195123828 /NCGR_PEP_ID=MMETSP0448-20130528/129501_1 /TAXON_ID=66468 /ORGANISM="Heterocapsa triquestra, Strain CCMP 448" /LENGTH=697 /DNA_ID=CAMNT_0040161399 /DNA_START=7 /DNA_END=2097 /DNA_ORIENTATION=-